jgi:dTDP-glucose 4,6-dehydratase
MNETNEEIYSVNNGKSRTATHRSIVAGGAGFIGSHLCDLLISEGHQVICIDNFLTGRIENIKHLLEHPNFVFILHDITKHLDLPTLLSELNHRLGSDGALLTQRDYLLHLASPASPKDYARFPIETLEAGALATRNALAVAKASGCAFLLASTSEVYGDPQVNPQSEEYWGHVNPIGPRSVYDEAKRFAEAITMAYAREFDVPVRIARIFNTYGERMRLNDGRALPTFFTQALQNKPVTVYGDGSQTRSFCYVRDTVEGLYRLLLSDQTGPINIGNPQEITLRELAETIIEETGGNSNIVYEPLPVDDPMRRRPDITKAVSTLQWTPKVDLHHGIQRVIPYFKSELAASLKKSSGSVAAIKQESGVLEQKSSRI